MSTPIRAVLFDAVGTLIYPDPSAVNVYFEAGRQFGSQLTRDDVAARFQAAVRAEEQADTPETNETTSGRFERRPTSETRERERWQRIVESVFADVPNSAGKLYATLWEHFADGSNWQVFADVPETMQRLAQLGLSLGIASNFDRRLVKISQRLQPLAPCKHVFCSSLIGYPKPSPKFFSAVERRLKLGSREILLVGDDWENDHEGATSAGWQTLHLDRSGGLQCEDSIGSLLEVVQACTGRPA